MALAPFERELHGLPTWVGSISLVRFRALSLSVAVALLLAGCAGAPQQPGSSAPTAASAATGAPAAALEQGVARRAGWRVEIPSGWVAVNREQLEAMPAEQVDSLASKMSVEGTYLQRLQEHEAFELYAADPLNPAEMRVAYSPERLIPTREVIQALASEFQGRDVN